MPRGVSITPQGRGGYTTIPEDLQYSLFEYPKDLLGSNNNNNNSNSNHNVRDAVFMDSWAKVRVFDDEGNLTVRQEGVRAFRFRQLAWFHALRSQSWSWLVGFSILVYLLIVLLFSVTYLVWSGVCGGASRSTSPHTNGIIALYFTVVSLAANGGYLGEEPTMIDPTSTCYAGRSVIVMGCSYVNILFVGLVAALVVGKAESTARLGHRIVFSSYCTLNTTTTEEKGGRASSRGGAASRRGRAAAPSWKLTFRMASMENLKPLAHGRLRLFCVSAESSSVYHEERRRRREREEHQKLHQRGDDDGAEDVTPNTTAENGGGRGRKGRPSHVSPPSSTSPKRQRHPRAPSVSTSSSSASDGDDGDNDAVLDSQQRRGRAREGRTDYGATATRATVDEHGIMKGDGGIAPLSSSSSPARSPTTSHVVDSLAAAVDMRRPYSNNNISSGSINTSELRRAHMCVTELEWSCPEERYLRDGPRGQLSLWYPATITHIIDENSPLYRFMHQPRRGADLLCPDAACCAPGGGDAAACCAHVGASDGSTDGADFQIVAVFDATDMDTSAIIMAKHTYITTDLVAHHRFSSKLVRIHPKSGGIRLDFHHFNDLVPTASQELTSTTNSD